MGRRRSLFSQRSMKEYAGMSPDAGKSFEIRKSRILKRAQKQEGHKT